MIRTFTFKAALSMLLIYAFCGIRTAFAQQPASKPDSLTIRAPFTNTESRNNQLKQGYLQPDPPGLVKTIEYDPVKNQYVLYQRVGSFDYRPPKYLTFSEYLLLKQREGTRVYFKQQADSYAYQSQQEGFIPQIKIRSHTFEQMFGSSDITIRPQGSAEMIMAGQINSNQNPLFNTKQRSQFNFNFNQRIQMNVTGSIGDKLKISTNYNTDAQYQFENQIKLDYTGNKDEIIQKIEVGTVSFPLNTTLITGTQALFGVKTKLKFGNLNVTSIFSQQRSQSKSITITNGAQQGNFSFTPADYEANRHYFLSQYFRDNYDKALANIPIISSNINITRIEVWVTNRTNNTTGSRDILGLMDLGENKPYNKSIVQGGAGYSGLPAGFSGPGFAQQSNNLLQNLPAAARQTNSNAINAYFQATGGNDNYARLTYARKLTDKEFTLHPQLGYISLNYPLNNDEVLAVAYQYTVNGVVYQVGEFSTDRPVNTATPEVLYVKLLKNALLKTSLPTWKLMMKNIYSLGAYQVSSSNFRMTISRLDESSGIAKPIMGEGLHTKSKLWLQLTGLDNLDSHNDKQPDGFFDFIEGVTIDSQNGRIIFPVLEPFGSDLSKQFDPGEQDLIRRYVYQPIYDSTKTIAQQFFPQLNRYLIKGTYTSQSGSEYQLNATNIPQGSVVVTAGSSKLVEGTDYNVDYSAGKIRIINQALLSSGQPITVNLENNELFGVQQKSLFGSRFDFKVNDNLALGATLMHLKETPITQNEVVGQESISNTIYGFDVNYNSPSRFLTRLVDKIPFVTTKVPSSVSFNGEFAQLLPGSPSALNFAGSKNGTSYLDDFESSQSVIDIKSASTWQISGTPQQFPESKSFNDLSYGYNRARIAFYNIDPIFYSGGTIPVSRTELSKPYVREVLETEVFPYKQSVTGQPLTLPTFDLAFYPNIRGPYNFRTTGLNSDGTLTNPQQKWGGIFRGISTNDFEALNVQYIEFWVMDPFIGKPNSQGGDLYFNLGNISEDILQDGRKGLENGIPVNGDQSQVDTTAWGRVVKTQPVVNAFDSNPASRTIQDIGLDGLNDADERSKFSTIVNQVKAQVSAQAGNTFNNDPSSDDYQYYQGPQLDQAGAGILQRYSQYNGTEGNSKTSEQSQALLGTPTSASTSLPDAEDVDRDNNMNQDDEYFQYHVSVRPQDMVVGQNFINDKVTSQVKLPNGTTQAVTWYQFRIPINSPQSVVGNIQDFKSIRFIRMFMTGFADTAIMRFATLQLVRGDWRAFNSENNPTNVIADPSIINPPLDNSSLDVETVNIEENGNRTPIPYVVPPGIIRQRNYNNLQTNTQLNEQSLSLNFSNLRDGYSRAAFKDFNNDLRKYKKLQMFIHAEGTQLKDNDVSAFIRLGVDYTDNYYEYEIPMKLTNAGTNDPNAIWPTENELDIELALLTNAKLARNNAKLNGQPWPLTVPFTLSDGKNKITIKGQPDLSRVATVMVGVRNPLKTNASTVVDDGLDKSGIIWFDELRMTDFDNKGGWAATGRFDAKLADFASLTVTGSRTTVGFGALDSRLADRTLNDTKVYDVSGSVELGKFFPDKSGVHIPLYVNVSHQVSTPEYDPAQPDITLKQSLQAATSTKQRDSIQNTAEDYTLRKSINLTNVHKTKTNPSAPNHVWDIENFNATYSYIEYNHHDFTTLSDFEKTYHASLAYNFATQPKYYSPFEKVIKSNLLSLIRDINIDLIPSRLNYSINFDRFYSENTLRNNDPNNIIAIPTTFNKTFNITSVYGLGWNLTKSLTLDIDATNLATVDEPAGRLDGLKRDTLWENILHLGRTTNYNHTLTLNYTLPLNKLPYMDWTAVVARYSTHFTWQTQPLFAINDPAYNVGNSILNSRTIQLNPTFNMATLYNKFAFYKRLTAKPAKDGEETSGIGKVFLGLLTSIKNLSAAYTRTEGTFIPGYLPNSGFAGEDFNYNAPGIGFLLGSQADIRQKAVSKGWLTTDTLQNQLYLRTLNEDLHLKGSLELFKDFRIELIAFKTQNHSYQSNFKYLPSSGTFENLTPSTTGDYTISYMSIATAFSKISGIDNSSPTFTKFEQNRAVISQRLGALNPNSAKGAVGNYTDGYSQNSQNVVVPAFLAAYTGKNASSIGLGSFPSFPIPNWDIRYSGLSRIPFLSELFESVDIRNGYRSTFTVGNYTTLQQYQVANGAVSSRDANNDFLPLYQFSSVTIFEQFVPLLGIDMRFKNNLTANVEYRQTRTLNLSLSNSQLAQQNEDILVLGFGYKTRNFRFPFGMFNGTKLNNDLTFKMDLSLRDNKTLVYQADIPGAQISSGARNITYRPEIDYVINQRFNLSLFYDTNITKPFTSQTFNTSFTNFGVNLKLLLQ
ncbi:cell surface protein SprA [Mucilaginibacter ginsenosidivorans]|uniref:Cell surface protein SprA n=2 Tax=Mucilaginibacter ginsenosidivorans TaxID=398053 RepID=A0A5B8UQI3_9SPHI|nr:cell surface protein SprA [Mucilaginibacter ginsenosidivorans]QEC61088.1 cell surface protein SprA [Mucilaginibacter ginsenosidivorans]